MTATITRQPRGGLLIHRDTCKAKGVELPLTAELREQAKACSKCKPTAEMTAAARANAATTEDAANAAAGEAAGLPVEDLIAEPRIGKATAKRQNKLDADRAAGKTRQPRGGKTGDPRADRAKHRAGSEQPQTVSAALAAEAKAWDEAGITQPLTHRPTSGVLLAAGICWAPTTATTNPEALTGLLRCYGTCGQALPAARFPFTRNRGDGAGRYVECSACQRKRLTENKTAATPAPRPKASVNGKAEPASSPALRGAARAEALNARLGSSKAATR